MTMTRLAIIASLVLMNAARVVLAHPIVIHSGEVGWDDRGLRISLRFDDHSLQHEIDAIGGGATPDKVIRILAASIKVVTHESGRTIPAECDEIADDHGITCVFNVPPDSSAVALLHQPTNQSAFLPRQFQLTRRSPTGESTRIIRLTSRGNHAVLLRNQQPDKSTLVDPFNEPVMRIIAIGKSETQIQIDYPLTVLAAWPKLLAVDSDTVTTQQFKQSRSAIAKWAIERFRIHDPKGNSLPLTAPQIDLIDPLDATIDSSGNGAFPIYTTRARVHFAFNHHTPEAIASITWSGFNTTVLQMPVLWINNDTESLIGMVSPSQPDLKIERLAGGF